MVDGASVAMGLFGLAQQGIGMINNQAQRASARSENRRIARKQYKHDKKVWKHNWKNTQRQYAQAVRETAIQRVNNQNQVDFKNKTADQDWNCLLYTSPSPRDS